MTKENKLLLLAVVIGFVMLLGGAVLLTFIPKLVIMALVFIEVGGVLFLTCGALLLTNLMNGSL